MVISHILKGLVLKLLKRILMSSWPWVIQRIRDLCDWTEMPRSFAERIPIQWLCMSVDFLCLCMCVCTYLFMLALVHVCLYVCVCFGVWACVCTLMCGRIRNGHRNQEFYLLLALQLMNAAIRTRIAYSWSPSLLPSSAGTSGCGASGFYFCSPTGQGSPRQKTSFLRWTPDTVLILPMRFSE